MSKIKPTKQDFKKEDAAESAKFIRILLISTIVLILLMYFIFFR